MKAFQNNPISEHKFLPIVSLEPQDDITWGPAIRGENGHSYYASFLPTAFIVPYLFFQITRLPLNEVSLYWFTTIISLLCLWQLLLFFEKIFRNRISYAVIAATTFFNILRKPRNASFRWFGILGADVISIGFYFAVKILFKING